MLIATVLMLKQAWNGLIYKHSKGFAMEGVSRCFVIHRAMCVFV